MVCGAEELSRQRNRPGRRSRCRAMIRLSRFIRFSIPAARQMISCTDRISPTPSIVSSSAATWARQAASHSRCRRALAHHCCSVRAFMFCLSPLISHRRLTRMLCGGPIAVTAILHKRVLGRSSPSDMSRKGLRDEMCAVVRSGQDGEKLSGTAKESSRHFSSISDRSKRAPVVYEGFYRRPRCRIYFIERLVAAFLMRSATASGCDT